METGKEATPEPVHISEGTVDGPSNQDAAADTDAEFDQIVAHLKKDDNSLAETEDSEDMDTAFDKIIYCLDQMLDENEAKLQLTMN